MNARTVVSYSMRGRYVIDLPNPANSGKAYCHQGDPEDDIYLRERVLMALLDKRLAKLIHDGQPKLKDWRDGKEYQPYNHDQPRGLVGNPQRYPCFPSEHVRPEALSST